MGVYSHRDDSKTSGWTKAHPYDGGHDAGSEASSIYSHLSVLAGPREEASHSGDIAKTNFAQVMMKTPMNEHTNQSYLSLNLI